MKTKIFRPATTLLLGAFVILCLSPLSSLAKAGDSEEYVKKAWAASGKKDLKELQKVVDECIDKFGKKADQQASKLTQMPPQSEVNSYKTMNDVATCYFILGEALRNEGQPEKAKEVLQEAIDKYPFAQAFDPRGWYWSVAEKCKVVMAEIDGEYYEPPHQVHPVTPIKLHDPGTEFPVNYKKYGKFEGVGTKDYKYIIDDPIGLGKAVGEGIYPNSTSVKFNPDFAEIKKRLYKMDHWKVLEKRDHQTSFFKWTLAPESQGTKLFYIAGLLEESGLIEHAIKAYYAIIVHFPKTYSWTYWHTPWYVGRAALYQLQSLLRQHPRLELKLEDAYVTVVNGNDHDIRNDEFIVNPGKLVKMSLIEKVRSRVIPCGVKKRHTANIVEKRGGKDIYLAKFDNGDWKFMVNGKQFMIKGVTYAPTRVGEAPDDQSLQNWTTQDTNQNGKIDGPYDAWVDKNQNDKQDSNEKVVGDFALMKEMGVNCIRQYYQPHPLNKDLLRDLYETYGIYTAVGDFLGKYALGSGADWETGTDYDNEEHKKNMLQSVRNMVNEFKDEEFILMWILGNENVYGLGCNADKKPESFFKFANEAAKLIKELDPKQRPVAIASGDSLYLNVFAEYCPDIDIFGTNSYRGKYGFLDLWDEIRRVTGKAAMITEYGVSAYAMGYTMDESEEFQSEYHKACWNDMICNSYGYGAGDAIGGFVFQWVDEWWKAYRPQYHDRKGLFTGPFLDGYMHEEWLGVTGQGNGENSPFLRVLRKAFYTYKDLWNKN